MVVIMSDHIFNEILVYFFYRNPPQLPQDFEFCNRPNISFCIDKMGNPPPPPLPPPPLPNNGNDVLDTGGIGWGVFALNVIFIIFYIQSSYKIDFKPKYITPSYYNTTHQNVSTIINNTNIHLSNMQQNETV
jgi:hypothetical protein